jgi:hypothetical protein
LPLSGLAFGHDPASPGDPPRYVDANRVLYAVWLDPLEWLPWSLLTFVKMNDPSWQLVRRVPAGTDIADLSDSDLAELLLEVPPVEEAPELIERTGTDNGRLKGAQG